MMDQQRQKAFQKLRPTCVELSSVALRFKGHQAAVKDVLLVLEKQNQVLADLGQQNQLDEKLAEYAFFPLTHVFNGSQRLSPRCLQVAVQSVFVLVSQGYRLKLSPVMGKQLLVLMTLIVNDDPRRQSQPPTDELKTTVFECIGVLIDWLARSAKGKAVLQDQSNRNIVDQLAYLLVDSLTESISDDVQKAAAEALSQLFVSIDNRVFLASLLPRTVSSLTKALRPSTQARRTRRVLTTNLKLLGTVLKFVLADNAQYGDLQDEAEKEVLDAAWLNATTGQTKNALAQVCKLRTHDHVDVRNALLAFCVMLIEECSRTLKDSIPVLVETSMMLTDDTDTENSVARLKMTITTRPELAEILHSSFYDWSQSLPRIMQSSDDRTKKSMLAMITNTFNMLSETVSNNSDLINVLWPTVLKGVTGVVELEGGKHIQTYTSGGDQHLSLVKEEVTHNSSTFEPVLFAHQSQKDSAQNLQTLLYEIRQHPSGGSITRKIVDAIPNFTSDQLIAPVWLALELLKKGPGSSLHFDDIIDFAETSTDRATSQNFLIHDLYTHTKGILLDSSPHETASSSKDDRIIALAIESVALQAQQLGQQYRDELFETLYPIIALLDSRNILIRNHAITALNILASSCGYASVPALLIENVDYLVNSIAWKLNTFNLSPEAPAVLNMILRLVGAKVVPYLDDLVVSIFAALDSFHGYTQWVEMLFEVLRTMVDESVKQPNLAIADAKHETLSRQSGYEISSTEDIINDLQMRKRRKLSPGTSTHTDLRTRESAPRRPWTRAQDDPNYRPDPTEGKDLETLLREAETADEENDLPAPKEPEEEDPTKPLSKSHDHLLKIAQATVTHLSSPSARVRHILLQLLGQISPLLARHQNTFLPLVNAVWPGIAQRLFADITAAVSQEEQDSTGEVAYNVAAAIDIVAGLCEHAGDFMGSRIEQIFGQLKTMFLKTWKEVDAQMTRSKKKNAGGSGSVVEDLTGENIRGVVDLQVVKTGPAILPMVNGISGASSTAMSAVSRTSTGQVFTSLVRLLIAVLNHVQVSEDNAGQVFDMLAPLLDHPGAVGEQVNKTLETYNSDAVWTMRCRKRGEDEVAMGKRALNDRIWQEIEMPSLSEELNRQGLKLQPVVF